MTVKTFFAKYWAVALMFATIGAMQFFPTTTKYTSPTVDNRIDCGNRETKAMIVHMAKERTGAHNLSDSMVAHQICK
jgi:hypothetical protein